MPDLGFAEAFAKYGAKLKNPNWSVCDQAADGSLAKSFWQHHITREGDGLVCRDRFERWSGPGRNELRRCLEQALTSHQPIRVVIAITPFPERVDAGGDASKIPKTFSVRQDLVGQVVAVDDEGFTVTFTGRLA